MVDLSFLEKFSKGDTKKMKRYIDLYLDVVPKTFEVMQQNLKNNDLEQLRIHAHSLKPQADFMGVSELKNTLINIEDAIKAKDLYQIKEQFELATKISAKSYKILKDFEN